MLDLLKQLFTYNAEANRRFIETLRAAPPTNEKIASIVNHTLQAHRIWNWRIGGVSPTGTPWEPFPAETWAEVNRENFQRSLEIVAAGEVERFLDYRDTKGQPYRNRVQDILFHVVNHSSYHRGQLATLLGQEEKKPPVTDYIVYQRDSGL